MADASLALQGALLTALRNASALTALLPDGTTDIIDFAEPTKQPPYVQVGEFTAIDGGDKTQQGQEHTATIHFWSRQRGHKEVKQLMGAAYGALHEAALSVSGQTVALCRFDFGQSFLDEDGLTYHGVQRYRVETYAT